MLAAADITPLHTQPRHATSFVSSSAALQSALDAIPAHIAIIDQQGTIIYANPAWQQFVADHGFDPRMLTVGANLVKFSEDAGDLAIIAESVRDVLSNSPFPYVTEFACTICATPHWYSLTAAPIQHPNGSPQVLVRLLDITEHRLAEQQAEEEHTFAATVAEITTSLVRTLDVDTVMMRIVDGVKRLVPHSAANIMLIDHGFIRPRYWHGYSPDGDRLLQHANLDLDEWPVIQKAMHNQTPYRVMDTRTEADWQITGALEWIRSALLCPIRIRGQVLGLLTLDSSEPYFFTDEHARRLQVFADQAAIALQNAQLYHALQQNINSLEQRVAERTAQLHQSKVQAETLLNSSSDAIVELGVTGIVRHANLNFIRTFDRDTEAKAVRFTSYLDPASARAFEQGMQSVLLNHAPATLELAMTQADGNSIDVEMTLNPILHAEETSVICAIHDITRFKVSEAALRAALQNARELDDMRRQLLNIISHEFRNPLSVIMTSSDLLARYLDRMQPEQRDEHFSRMQEAVHHLTMLIDDVVSARDGDTESTLHRVPINLEHLVHTVADQFQTTTGAQRQIRAATNGSASTLWADERMLWGILSNLLSNAVKYSPEHSPIEVVAHLDDTELTLRVTDHGIGIADDDQPCLFDAFFRGRNTGATEGTGLGLFLVARSARAHGGDIRCESRLGEGSTFIVTLPNPAGPQGAADLLPREERH